MTKTTLLLLLLALMGLTAPAQKNTYLGIEGHLNTDRYEIIDEGSLLKNVSPLSAYYGFHIRQDLSPTVFVEAGLLRKNYAEGIGFTTSTGYSSGDAISALLIPVRLGTRINLRKQKLHLVPVIGYVRGINTDYGYGDGGIGGFEIYGTDTIHHSVHSKLSIRKAYPLLQTGMGLEFIFLRTALVSLSANYYTGFKTLIEQDIEYRHNSSAPYTAKGLSKGEFLSLGLAVKYPISSIWKGKGR